MLQIELKCLCFSYLIMENVRYMLSQYHHETSLYFGCRYITESTMEGYMAGGGYILSKKALSKLNENILPNENMCRSDNGGPEDLEMGNNCNCLFQIKIIYISDSQSNSRTMSCEHYNIC